MQNSLTFSGLYTRYAAGLMKKNDFKTAIFKKIQEDIGFEKHPGWNKEDYDDFISSIYFRLDRMIDVYRDVGSSFETYVGAIVRLLGKEYRARKYRSDACETAAWIVQIPDMYVCEEAPDYDDSAATEDAPAPGISRFLRTPRQLLILILKCCNYLTDDFVEKVSPMLGIEPETLNGMIRRLRAHRVKREADLKLLHERINSQLYRCVLYEKSLQTVAEGSGAEMRLQKRLERGRERLRNMRKRLSRIRLDPSNCHIAELLGLSKGTVDTTLHSIKRRWSNNRNL